MTTDYKALEREILTKLDLRAKAESWGLRFDGTPNAKGWLSCHAVGRDDATPSAGLNVASANGSLGKYRDHGNGDGKAISFFDLGVLSGKYRDWKEARADLAKEAGVKLPSKGHRTWQTVAEWWATKIPGVLAGHWLYHKANGEESFVVCRYNLGTIDAKTGKPDKKFRPIHLRDDGTWKSGDPEGLLPLYRLTTLPEATTVYCPEGEKAADALAAMGLTATTTAHGSKSAHKSDLKPLAGKTVVLLPDNDPSGESYVGKMTAELAKLDPLPVVKKIVLPDLPPAGDAVEFVAARREAGRTDAEIRAEVEALAEAATPVDLSAVAVVESATIEDDGRAKITLSTDEHLCIAQAIEALTADPDIYQRGGLLVDVVNDSLPKRKGVKAPEAPRIMPIPEARLRTRLSACARYVVLRESEGDVAEVPQHPPGWLVKGVAAAGLWPNIRQLEAVVTAPVMRGDGSVLQTPGYDAESGILYIPRREYPEVPDVPLADEVSVAVDTLDEVICDFPFERDEHRAAWFAATLTPLARFAFDGPAPLFLLDANIRGAGKGLAVDAAGIIATGDALAITPYVHDDAEMRKQITSFAMAGDRAVVWDNIGGAFGLPSLDAALTSTRWKNRRLGTNEDVNLPLVVTWYGTGNNVVLTGDVVRRICHIRLNSPEETPEERAGFRHPDLRAWVTAEQPRLLVAALTLLRAYIVAGRPDMKLKPWGSFEGWSALVRNAVVFAGLPDPGATRQELAKQSDTEGAQLRALLAGWQEIDPTGLGLTVGEVFDRLGEAGPSVFPTLRAALNESCAGRKGDRPTPRNLAYRLRHFRRRVIGGRYFDTMGEIGSGNIWGVKGNDGDDGDDGDV